MAVYRLNSHGPEVERIQQRLKTLGMYRGSVDGHFGGGTFSAVRKFQAVNSLKDDGVVGPQTWTALFTEDIPDSGLSQAPLDYKCLSLTGTFETNSPPPQCFASLSGDFDGMGISMGVCQWNLGQGSLQPLFQDMVDQYEDVAEEIFGDHLSAIQDILDGDIDDSLTFARSIQHPAKFVIFEPWRGMFKTLGRSREFQNIQVRHAANIYKKSIELCGAYKLISQRAVALMFDIITQNGSIKPIVKTLIMNDYKFIPDDLDGQDTEVARMRIIANRRADAANARWKEDVRSRKLCIANGHGAVHGVEISLSDQFGIELAAAKELNI